MLKALPYCCNLCSASKGYALHQSLSVVAGCLSNGRLHQQWACTSVGADCLGNGGRPSPTEVLHPGFSCAHSKTLHLERLESPFCLSHCAGPNAVSLESPGLAHCPSLVESDGYANLPSQVSDCRFNRDPRPMHFVRSAVEHCCASAPAASCTSQNRWAGVPRLFLYLGISPFCGLQRSIWKCGPDSPSASSPRASILGCSHCAILSLSLSIHNSLSVN